MKLNFSTYQKDKIEIDMGAQKLIDVKELIQNTPLGTLSNSIEFFSVALSPFLL